MIVAATVEVHSPGATGGEAAEAVVARALATIARFRHVSIFAQQNEKVELRPTASALVHFYLYLIYVLSQHVCTCAQSRISRARFSLHYTVRELFI